jgi:recombinational DNA repair ATPase RecF
MKIETIAINGFKKLQQFAIDPAGKSVEIKGKNGQGKSSIIDAIWCTLTGKDVPGVPVNKDSVSAKIVVGLDSGHTARLSFSAKGGKSLVVEGPDGEPVKAPAAFLENLIGKISFDPFDFVSQPPAKQKAFLQQLLGLDFTEIESRKSAALAEKKAIEEDAKAIERDADKLVDAKKTERVDVAELVAKQNERAETIRKGQAAAEDLKLAEGVAQRLTESVASIKSQIAELTTKLAGVEMESEAAQAAIVPRKAELERLRAVVAEMPDNSEAIRNAGDINKAADDWDKRVELVAGSKKIAGDIAAVKAKLEAIEKDRSELLFAAKFPVPGLSFSTDGVLFNGLPFDSGNQCQSDILRVGVAIAVAQNPALKIVRIKDGSLLDSTAKAELLAMLAESGFQAFIETVADCGLQALTIEEIPA